MQFNPYDDFITAPWPLVVKLKPDELLTSWLTRLSYNHLLKVHTFCSINFPGVSVWNRDFDKCVPGSVLEVLSRKTLTSAEQVKQSTLSSYESFLFEKCHIKTNTEWIMPMHIVHRIRKRCALSYCPNCLRLDNHEPYYRKKWRLSLSIVCPQCQCYLYEKCFCCSSPVNFHRIELGRRSQVPYFPISSCYNCLAGLDNAPIIGAPKELIDMQKKIYNYIDTGFASYYNCQYSHLFFAVLRQIVKIICSKMPMFELFNKTIAIEMGLPHVKFNGGYSNNFDMLGLEERSTVLQKAMWLLDDWPDRFINTTKASKIWSSALLKDFTNVPYWFWKEIKLNNYIVFSEWKNQLKDYPKHSSYNNLILSRLKKKNKSN